MLQASINSNSDQHMHWNQMLGMVMYFISFAMNWHNDFEIEKTCDMFIHIIGKNFVICFTNEKNIHGH